MMAAEIKADVKLAKRMGCSTTSARR